MSKYSIQLGEIFGISIRLGPTWFLIFIFLTWSLAFDYYPQEFENWQPFQYWIVGAITTILLFGSVMLHELGHSIVSIRNHIPVRSITLFIFGGVAQIEEEPSKPMTEFWISIAGPFVSFVLAFLFYVLQLFTKNIEPLYGLFRYLAVINGTLALFNLIPGFPLDGGRVFRAFVWHLTNDFNRATWIAANVGRTIAFLFIAYGGWQVIMGNIGDGLWITFIGWFLESAAVAQLGQTYVYGLLSGHFVIEAMNRHYNEVDENTSLQVLMDDHIVAKGRRYFLVKSGDEVVGLLTVHHLQQIPKSKRAMLSVKDVMIPIKEVRSVRLETELSDVLREMDRDGVNQLPVVEAGQVLGIITREDLISFLKKQAAKHQESGVLPV
jgi:Zn-dependent protease